MDRFEILTNALRGLVAALDKNIDGLPDNPWIPGGNFQDGMLLRELKMAKRALDPPASQYPEHDRLGAINHRTQAIGDFLDWLDTERIFLHQYDEESDVCYPISRTRERLIGGWAEIDPDKLEAEKMAMLADIRKRNREAPDGQPSS